MAAMPRPVPKVLVVDDVEVGMLRAMLVISG